nr:hypothetical protein [Myxococcota bacterium]
MRGAARALVVVGLAVLASGADGSGSGRAEQVGAELRTREPAPQLTDWSLRIDQPQSDDGRHLGISWTRPPVHAAGTVLVLRRGAAPGEQ